MLDFYQSYSIIDIWREFDTKSGKESFQFFYKGQTYERPTRSEILTLAKQLLEQKVK